MRDPEKYAEPRSQYDPPTRHPVWRVSLDEAERGAPLAAIDHAGSEQEALQSLKVFVQMPHKRGVKQFLIGVEFGVVQGHAGWFAIWC
jgi:hypothetical protein